MIDPGHRGLRESLGAYALGQLTDDEAVTVERHLAMCPTCPAELAELMPAAAALAAVRTGAIAGVTPRTAEPSADMAARIEERIRAAVRREAWFRTTRAAAVTAVGAAAAAVVLVVGLRVTEPEAAPKVPLEAVEIYDEAAGVTASADLVDHTWGVEVKLVASGLRMGGQYAVTVTGAGGAAYPAGAFVGTGAKPVKCNLNASVLRDDATGFVVSDERGIVVLRSDFG